MQQETTKPTTKNQVNKKQQARIKMQQETSKS